jgi:hypothetical protein
MDTSYVNSPTNFLGKYNLNLSHLQAELARLDVRLQSEVRRWQIAGQDPSDAFRGLYVSDIEAQKLVDRPFATAWGHTVSLDQAEEQAFTRDLERAAHRIEEIRTLAIQEGHRLPLDHLCLIFGLGDFEINVLLICLAPHLDLRYERLYGYLQDDVTKKHPTVHLALNLLCGPGKERLEALSFFRESAPLLKRQIVTLSEDTNASPTPLLSRYLHPDGTIVDWLLGEYQPGEEYRGTISFTPPGLKKTEFDIIVGPAAVEIERLLDGNPILAFYGPDLTSQEAAASGAARKLQRGVLKIDLSEFVKKEGSADSALQRALRDSLLTGALPFLSGWDACFKDGDLPASLLALVLDHPEPVIVSGRALWQATGVQRTRPIYWLEFPIPVYEQRLALWSYYLDGETTVQSADLTALAGAFALTSGQIRDAVASAHDLARRQGASLAEGHLLMAARAHSNPRLSSLAHKITPRYGWQDIVLPEDQMSLLNEIVITIRTRQKVLEEWGLGLKLVSSRGITVLFAGPPGTGKTMAAEVIAAELSLDLYKIDLSTVVSKYIGETEKNLERIFSEAEASNAILFFDEADALFGKRSEVRDSHDRYANIEVSYLLQRMEAYDGVSVLATNLRANLDEAFTRRLQFAVDFPFPDDADRGRIWRALFPPDAPRAADLDFDRLAKRYKLAGGNIRNVLVSAAYLAAADGGVVNMEHLLHGVRREMQKMGRLVGEADF